MEGATTPVRVGAAELVSSFTASPADLATLKDRVDCLLFDLDDTLFDQMHYLQGAFRAAADTCGTEFASRLARAMVQVTEELGSSCGRIFDEALRREAVNLDDAAIRRMVGAFRAHQPEQLSCFPGVREGLVELSQRWPLGLITDGPVETQVAKLHALGIEPLFSAVVLSDKIGGRTTRKPSPVPYRAALDTLGVRPERAVYVGDNPTKDFVGARALGMATVRIRTGEYRHLEAQPGHEADWVLDSLVELLEQLR